MSTTNFLTNGYVGSFFQSEMEINKLRIYRNDTCGLVNMNNACYMNAIMQCLSNCDFIKKDFIQKIRRYYQNSIMSFDNLIINDQNNSKDSKILHNFIVLLHQLWNDKYYCDAGKLRHAISIRHQNFCSMDQMDAHEFITYLLDDLDEVTKFKNEKLSTSMKRIIYESPISNIFQGEVTSTITCINCNYDHVNKENFCSLATNILKVRSLSVILIFQSGIIEKINSKFFLNDTVQHLLNIFSNQYKVESDNLLFYYANRGRFVSFINPSNTIASINSNYEIISYESPCKVKDCYQIPVQQVAWYRNIPAICAYCKEKASSLCANCRNIMYCSKKCQEVDYVKHTKNCSPLLSFIGYPQILNIQKEHINFMTKNDLNDQLLNLADKTVVISRKNFEPKTNEISCTEPQFLDSQEIKFDDISASNIFELCHVYAKKSSNQEIKEHLGKNENEWKYLSNKTIYSVWKNKQSETFYSIETIPLDISPKSLNISLLNQLNLSNSLKKYFDVEYISYTSGWRCSNCQEISSIHKHLEISKLPKVLIIQWKRNTDHVKSFNKDQTFMSYPIDNLNMKQFTSIDISEKNDAHFQYNLNCVVLHHGPRTNHGHYTAFIRKYSMENDWIMYDDVIKNAVEIDKIQSPDAYLLFYHQVSSVVTLIKEQLSVLEELD
ncbi:hypothetical protein A3Q56_03913 [Intoshia linei]|uniref:ubiquitinyl hydrolase 1 n=1 Tax=Intoshia linei TaxID=1819745 RepID=A0A177B244_9BILA|nr:hypothetical protein A3Q56_03913 [Intoshia linei]